MVGKIQERPSRTCHHPVNQIFESVDISLVDYRKNKFYEVRKTMELTYIDT